MYRNRVAILDPFRSFNHEIDRVFAEMLRGWPRAEMRGKAGFPALNVLETESSVIVEAELPGVRSEDLDIKVQGKELTLEGRRPEPSGDGVTVRRRERGAGEFTRIVQLAHEIDVDRVTASLEDGVLTVTLPKVVSEIPKKIPIGS